MDSVRLGLGGHLGDQGARVTAVELASPSHSLLGATAWESAWAWGAFALERVLSCRISTRTDAAGSWAGRRFGTKTARFKGVVEGEQWRTSQLGAQPKSTTAAARTAMQEVSTTWSWIGSFAVELPRVEATSELGIRSAT